MGSAISLLCLRAPLNSLILETPGVFILNITPQREAGIGRPSSIWVMLHMGYALPTPSLWVVPEPWLWVLCFMHWTGTGPCSFAQSCLTLCDSMDWSPLGSSVRGFFQTRMWNGLPFPSSGIFPTQGSHPCLFYLLRWQVDSLPLCHMESAWVMLAFF